MQAIVEAPETADDKEMKLLLSMGWVPDEEDDEEGGLEEWEIDAAQESFMEHLQGQPREGLRERAQREFEAWKAEQITRENAMEPCALAPPPGLPLPPGLFPPPPGLDPPPHAIGGYPSSASAGLVE